MSAHQHVTDRLDAAIAFGGLFASVAMTEYKWEVVKDLIVTALLAGLAYQALSLEFPATASLGVVAIGLVNTVTTADILSYIRARKGSRMAERRQQAREHESHD